MRKVYSRFGIGSFFFMHGLCFSSWASRIPAIQAKLNLSEAQLGSILFSVPLGSLISMPIAAGIVSRFGSRRVLVFAIILYGVNLVVLGLIGSRFQLFIFLVFFGFASSLVNVSLNTQAVHGEALFERPIMASFHGMWSLAGFFGASMGALMIGKSVVPVSHFGVTFLIILSGTVLASRFLLTDFPQNSKQTQSFMIPKGVLLELGIICFCVMVCEGTMFDWSGVYFSKIIHAEGASVSVGYVAFMTTMAGTRFLADQFKERYGFSKVVRWSGFMIFFGMMISILFPFMIAATLGLLLVGCGVSAVVPLVLSEAGKNKIFSTSASITAVSSIGFLGFLVGPPVVGWIADLTSLRVSFAFVSLLGLCIAVLSKRHLA